MESPAFRVGTLPISGRLILAPMDGFSDLPFRSLCREFGSAMSYTSFVSAAAIVARSPSALASLAYLPQERPVAFQIFDDDPARLLEAGRRLIDLQPDILDINMGCSARCVSGRGAGAGLLRDPAKIGRIVGSLSRALPIPITAKIRLGWDDATRNYLDVARAIADNGGRLIAVHGRTRQQGYRGRADHAPIGEIKAAVPIPVLGNGDVASADAARDLMQATGCDGVLIGRAAIGNPWVFRGLPADCVPPAEVLRVAREHLRRMTVFHDEPRAVVLFRKHLARYLDRLDAPSSARAVCLAAETVGEVLAAVECLARPVAAAPTPPLPASRFAAAAGL